MCGYVGEISLRPTVERTRLYHRNNTLLHRGPDESDILVSSDRRWGVGHRRLAVVDLAGGRQPMVDADRGLTLVFNGEIYDHDRLRGELERQGYPFRTRSDTEVLLALYAMHGEACFEHLRGEFSFAMIDERRRVAVLGRDRFGIKPLFYTRSGERFLFASEIKALFRDSQVERRIDPAGLIAAISVADTPGRTVFAGVRQVRHAHFLRVSLDTLEASEHRYWDALERRRTDVPSDPREQAEMVRAEIDKAVSLRLRADVPVGAYLSGGIDSSLVAATMAGKMDRLDAFALSFEDSPRHDEFPYARSVADRWPNIALHRIPVTYSGMIRRLPEAVWHLERPFGNLHSIAKIMAAQFAREHVVCVLTGDGGDEAFCGYSTHWLQNELQASGYAFDKIRAKLGSMKAEARRIGGNRYYLSGGLARRVGPETRFLEEKLGFRPCDLATSVDADQRIRRLMTRDFLAQVDEPPVERLATQLAPMLAFADDLPHAVLLQYIQLNSSVPEYISTIADRSETSGSVEARLPLFDHKVVELAMGLPLEAKLKGDREKHVLREAYRDVLPREVIDRRKQAFLAPPAPFSCLDGRNILERYLSPRAVKNAGIWEPWKIAALKTARSAMPRNRIFNLILTIVATAQILHEQFVEKNGTWR